MELLWNKLDLNRPSTSSWTTSSDKFDVKHFNQSINKIHNDLQSQELFHKEATILSRLIYRMKTKFRHDKGLKNMEKVNRALCNYFHLSLDKEYNNLKDSVIIDNSNVVILPTRQMLQYVLVKTQGFAKLMCRIQDTAFCAGEFFRARVIMGQAWTFSMIAWSTVARIWMLSRNLVKKCCIWYNNMYPFLMKLEMIGVNWLPLDYSLPSDLRDWLSLSWINEQTECSLAVEKLSNNSMFSLIKTQDELADVDEESAIGNENELNEQKSVPKNEVKIIPVTTHDVGVPISRESFNFNLEMEKKKVWISYNGIL
ncbi:hypothetical protein PV326_009024 [Microctonus aethiopoides]|nr:hypothetical protein PV326_009024 [Microctonus aethiopoides]